MRQRVTAIVARYAELMASAPEMTGISLAFDRGNITAEELDAYETRRQQIDAECELLRGRLDECERDDAASFRQYLEEEREAIGTRERGPLAEHQAWCLAQARACIDFRLGRRTEPARDLLWGLSVARA